jgi:putative Holliday junction resolvase
MAIDVGDRRVGVAVSDETGLIARPLTIIHRRSKAEDFAKVARLVQEQGVGTLVVGQPLNADGSVGPQAARVEKYAHALAQALRAGELEIDMVFWDEYLSTQRAREMMIAAGRRSRERQKHLDAAAAAVILQDYLDSQLSHRLGQTGEVVA